MDYKESFVAFIDILGFKELVKTNKINRVLEVVTKFQTHSKNWNEDFFVNLKLVDNQYLKEKGLKPESDTIRYDGNNLRITLFSDLIIWSYPIEEVKQEPYNALLQFMLAIQGFTRTMLHYGIMIRGGITIGDIYHQGAVCFGEGVIKAYELEQKAIYPRIIIDPAILSDARLNNEFIKLYPIEKYGDDYFFVNHFKDVEFLIGMYKHRHDDMDKKVATELMLDYKNNIEKGLDHPEEKVVIKYKWLADQYNATWNLIIKSQRFSEDEINNLKLK